MKILVIVGTEQSENLCRRKGKGSLAMNIIQGLVDPNGFRNRYAGKGNRLIFLYFYCICGNTSFAFDTLE